MNYLMVSNWDGDIYWGIYTRQELEDRLNDEESKTNRYVTITEISSTENLDFEDVIDRLNEKGQTPNRTIVILKFEIVNPRLTKYTID